MALRKLSFNSILKSIGSILFFVFILVVMADPTNTIFHKKDITFILVVAYNMLVFRPNLNKLPYILLMFCAIAIPWLFSNMQMNNIDWDETVATLKAISPTLLLLWVDKYDLIKLSRGPVVLCCFVVSLVYIFMQSNPHIESMVWRFVSNSDYPFVMARRTILGQEIFAFYLKSTVSFLFVAAYYMLGLMDKKRFNIFNVIFFIFILFNFLVSGTRSTMLAPFFLFIVIAFKVYKNSKYMKYIMFPMIFFVAIVFLFIVYAAATETNEYSNAIKYGHLGSYATLFAENPLYLILGQGPGTSFYSEGFDDTVYVTEWTYLELIRCYGIFSLIIIFVFCKPLKTFWIYRNCDNFVYCMFWTYITYLFIAGTNPLLMSSTGMITLLMAYSYEDKVLREYG